MEVILDTSFILSCMRKRIDFLSQLEEQGFMVKIPKEVIQELKDLHSRSKTSEEDRICIKTIFDIFEKRKIKKTSLGTRNVDNGLIKKGKEGIYIATLDQFIKRNIPKKIVIFNAKNTVGVE